MIATLTRQIDKFQHLEEIFLLHGLTSLELFSELEEDDLDSFGISSPEDRAKVLTAAQLLLDYEGTYSETHVPL